MKLVNLTCPNCNGILERVGDNLFCKSCGSAFGIDYDSADVEHEKLQTEDERARREFEQEKELMEIKYRQQEQSRIAAEKRNHKLETKRRISKAIGAKISALFALVLVFGFFYGSYRLCVHWGVIPTFKEIIESAKTTKASPYAVSESDVTKDILDNMVDTGKTFIETSKKNGVTEMVKKKKIVYTLSNVEYDSAYLIANESSRKNQVVILFKLTYDSSNGTKTTYDACYYDNLKISNNVLHSDYKPHSCSKSKIAWHSDSFEEREQCYRECVLGVEGKPYELKRK